jgi:hypothetical protein
LKIQRNRQQWTPDTERRQKNNKNTQFHMNLTSFKSPLVFKDHLFIVTKTISKYRFDICCVYPVMSKFHYNSTGIYRFPAAHVSLRSEGKSDWYGIRIMCLSGATFLNVGCWQRVSTLVSSTNQTDRHDITEILLKVALNTM